MSSILHVFLMAFSHTDTLKQRKHIFTPYLTVSGILLKINHCRQIKYYILFKWFRRIVFSLHEWAEVKLENGTELKAPVPFVMTGYSHGMIVFVFVFKLGRPYGIF